MLRHCNDMIKCAALTLIRVWGLFRHPMMIAWSSLYPLIFSIYSPLYLLQTPSYVIFLLHWRFWNNYSTWSTFWRRISIDKFAWKQSKSARNGSSYLKQDNQNIDPICLKGSVRVVWNTISFRFWNRVSIICIKNHGRFGNHKNILKTAAYIWLEKYNSTEDILCVIRDDFHSN